MLSAFVAPLPLPPLRRGTVVAASRSTCKARVPPSRMSLTNDLLIKTLEVAATSIFTNTVASTHMSKNNTPTQSAPPISKLFQDVFSQAQHIAANIDNGEPSVRRWQKLAICLAIDLAGAGSLSFPFLGDLLDIAYAPLSAVMVHALFASPLLSATAFAEEILPGTDAFPTATIAWIAENHQFLSSLRAPPPPPRA